jgi:methionyl-tRNA formyltransferase
MRIAIIGRSEILYETAIYLNEHKFKIACILTSKEAPEYRRTSDDFLNLANILGVPFCKENKVENFKQFLLSANADIAISVNCTTVLQQEIIDIFPFGILNGHGGDLPKYRGNACQAWAILAGERQIGLCIHKMIGGELDSGDILARDYLPIDQSTKITDIWIWMCKRAPELFLAAINSLQLNPHFFLEQQTKNPKFALRCYPRRPEDGRIDWTKTALDLLRLINACNKPYSGAFTYLDSAKVIIWDAELVEDNENYLAVPGQITKIMKNSVEVATGFGKLRIKTIEINGMEILPTKIIHSLRERFS